jgi:YVTN family beta-propeller protein
VEFRILGPLEVVDDDRPLQLGRGRERALLALLLLRANEVVATDVLIEHLWLDSPPATAPKALQVYVSRLRKHLGADVLVTRSPGYALEVRPEQFDLARFELLVEEARDAGPVETASMLRDALALWRGPPLAEFAYEPFAQAEIARLDELRLRALEDRIAADLALGRHAELVGELELLVSRNPLRECLRLQLMLALYRSGRQAEALDEYQAARRALTEELGLEPSTDLKSLERQILAHDPALDLPPSPEETVGTGAPDATSQRLSRRMRAILVGAIAVVLLGAAGAATVTVAWSGSSPPEVIVATPNSVAVIDPSTNRVVAAIPVGDAPTRIASP